MGMPGLTAWGGLLITGAYQGWRNPLRLGSLWRCWEPCRTNCQDQKAAASLEVPGAMQKFKH